MSTQPYKTTAGKIVPLGELEQMVTRGIIMAESGSPGSQFVTIKRGNGQANLVKGHSGFHANTGFFSANYC